MATMSRKDYVLIAETIRNLPTTASQDEIADAFADALRGTNPRFDRQRFITAATRPHDHATGTRYPQARTAEELFRETGPVADPEQESDDLRALKAKSYG